MVKFFNSRILFWLLFIFIIVACNRSNQLNVKDIIDNDVNILETEKEKIIIISSELVCHNCIENLNDFIYCNYNIKKYDYFVLTQGSRGIISRRVTIETYKNVYTPEVNKVLFTTEDSAVQKRLHIPKKLFHQPTPYVVYIGLNKKPIYHSYHEIFDSTGSVKESFKLN